MKYGERFDTEYGSMMITYRIVNAENSQPDEIYVSFDIRGDEKRIIFLNDSIVPPFASEDEAVDWFRDRALEHIAHNIYFYPNESVKIFPVLM